MPDRLKILVVEDDMKVSHTVSTSLRKAGYDTARFGSGKDALEFLSGERVDLVLLDLGLPDIDGLDVLLEIRTQSPGTPVLILTARDAVKDRVAGLDAGADDYLVKPFSLSELEARVRALSRRVDIGREAVLSCEDLELDTQARSATRNAEEIVLSPREFDLLVYLVERQGEVVTRTMLAEDVWHYTSRVTPIDNVIDVQMHRLREKIQSGHETKLLHTVRGVGFTLKAPE
jgi:two-component system copper resistance phosphate regulon response regulator CusR